MVQTPTLADIILAANEAHTQGLWTALPGRIVDYNASEQSATVQPIVRSAYLDEGGNRIDEALPALQRVPIMFPGSGAWSITWPVTAGATCLVVFTSCSLDRWLHLGGTDVDPADDRRNVLSDAVAIMGLRDFKNPVASTSSDAITIAGSQVLLGGADASDPVVRKSDLQNFVTEYLGHTHAVVGGGSTNAPGDALTYHCPACSPVTKTK